MEVTHDGKTYPVWLLLRCRAANSAQLAACHTEEASGYEREAWETGPDDGWTLTDPSGMGDNSRGLPDNWMELAEVPLPRETAAADRLRPTDDTKPDTGLAQAAGAVPLEVATERIDGPRDYWLYRPSDAGDTAPWVVLGEVATFDTDLLAALCADAEECGTDIRVMVRSLHPVAVAAMPEFEGW